MSFKTDDKFLTKTYFGLAFFITFSDLAHMSLLQTSEMRDEIMTVLPRLFLHSAVNLEVSPENTHTHPPTRRFLFEKQP